MTISGDSVSWTGKPTGPAKPDGWIALSGNANHQYHGQYLAADQPFRQWDLALDISEENSLPPNKVREIYDFCISRGANAAISNIHLNVWYGEYTKCDMALKILDNWNVKIDECVYVGDSPNDSPMFKKFPISVGVKSVLDYSDFMKDYPSYVTEKDGNQGFEDLVDSILSTK